MLVAPGAVHRPRRVHEKYACFGNTLLASWYGGVEYSSESPATFPLATSVGRPRHLVERVVTQGLPILH